MTMNQQEYIRKLNELEERKAAIFKEIDKLNAEYIASAPYKVGDKVSLKDKPDRKYYVIDASIGLLNIWYKLSVPRKDGSFPQGKGRYILDKIKAEELSNGWQED